MARLEEMTPLIPLVSDEDDALQAVTGGLDRDLDTDIYGGGDATDGDDTAPPGPTEGAPGAP